MDDNNVPNEPTPAPEPEAPATPTPPTKNPYEPVTGGKGPVPWSSAPDSTVPQDEKTQALLCWILGLLVSFIGPLIFLLIAKEKPFVYHHAAQSLTVSIVMAVLWIVAIVTCVGMLLMPFVGIFALVICIMGAIAANAGSRFDPPLFGAVSKALFKA